MAAASTSTPHTAAGVVDPLRVRADIPILQPDPATGRELAFLDSAASAMKPRQVLDAMRDAYEHAYANVHRGVYREAAEATRRFEHAREAVRAFIGAASPREVVFTRGTTESINLVAASWGGASLAPGDVVAVTELEHHANLVPWQAACARSGATLVRIPVDDDGVLDVTDLDAIVPAGGQLRLVALAHVSNALGTVAPLDIVTAWARSRGALVLVDAAQSVPHRPVDVTALDADFLAFSGHKAMGPTGIGVLWAREALLADMPPWQLGGEMIRQVTYETATWNDLPWKFEAGTPAIVEAIGLGAAIDYLDDLGMDAVHAHERAMTSYGEQLLAEIPGLRLLGPAPGAERGGVLSFTLDCAHPHDIATILDSHDVAIRAGHHCAQPLMGRLGVHATARASVYAYTTTTDLDRLADALRDVRRTFGGR